MPKKTVSRRVLIYLAVFAIFFGIFNAGVMLADNLHKQRYITEDVADLSGSGLLPEKRDFYLNNTERYDVLFLGDSRTLCGLHPDMLKPYTGLEGFTLAHWSNWLPTQYALIKDIIDDIPQDTLIVWSVGGDNFGLSPIEEIYPISWSNGISLAKAGYPAGDIINNLLYYTSVTSVIGQRVRVFNFLNTALAYPLASQVSEQSVARTPSANTADEGEMLRVFREEEGIGYIRTWYDQGRLVSVAQYKTNGAMLRTEIVPDFYRGKQAELTRTAVSENIHFNPTSWKIFTDILAMLQERGLRVVVNEMDLTPHRYVDQEDHWKTQDILRAKLKPVVESYGFDYVHVNYKKFTDEDYFDYNHMNAKGVKKFSADLGPQLKAIIERGDNAL